MDKQSVLIISVSVIVLMSVVAQFAWWLPQKWEASTKLYDNIPAQVICYTKQS